MRCILIDAYKREFLLIIPSINATMSDFFGNLLDEILEGSDDDAATTSTRFYKPRHSYKGADFKERFRLTEHQAERLLEEIGRELAPTSVVGTAMNAKDKLLFALRFYASNNFYYSEGDAMGFSKRAGLYLIL